MTPGLAIGLAILVYSILLNIPINYHPMNPLLAPALTSTSYTIANHLSKPLPTSTHHRFVSLIGVDPTAPADLAATATVATAPTVDTAPTVVASITAVDSLATVVASASTSVPTLHPNLDPASTLPIVLDTGASIPIASDFTPFGLIRSAALVVSIAKAASTPVDPYTLITGENVSGDTTDLSSSDSNSGCFELLSDLSALTAHLQSRRRYHLEVFGTATLTFVYSGFNTLVHIWVEPIDLDWIHWVPLPRLTLPESYFHIFGLDYLQAFALFHLIPIWI